MPFTSDDYVPDEKALANQERKLAGGTTKDALLRWHRGVNQISGAIVSLLRSERIATDMLEYWMSILLKAYWEMHDMVEENKKEQAHARGGTGHGDDGDGPGRRGGRTGIRGARRK